MRLWQILFQVVSTESRLLNTMGRKRNQQRKFNSFAQKKRARKEREANGTEPARAPHKPYDEVIRNNERFLAYYKTQQIVSDAEFETMLEFLKTDLPVTFRVTGFRDEAQALVDIIKTTFFSEYERAVTELRNAEGISDIEVKKPYCLPWYPNGLAWQLQLSRKDIRRSEPLFKLHNFLIAETAAGTISRQEAVSMIPPIILDVQPTDKVLDMCAAPGSKTAQLIEALHADGEEVIPTGFVVANDVDNSRCYMLVHQAKRLNSPCFIVTNNDSSVMPAFNLKNDKNEMEIMKFDRILCDVPCSGDGTLRKNADAWPKWSPAMGNNLHNLQYRILRRGLEQLQIGGRIVYSTCSLNPIENECVISRILKESEGAIELVDVSALLTGLKYIEGVKNWKVFSKDMRVFEKFDDVPENMRNNLKRDLFPLPEDEMNALHLERCIRILPHLQDTGGFFVAALMKTALLPWESKKIEQNTDSNIETEDKSDEVTDTRSRKEIKRQNRRMQGYKEDPFVFFSQDEPGFQELKTFYEIKDNFDYTCLLCRTAVGKKKNVYFCTPQVKNLVQSNEDKMKIINTGVRLLSRCDNKNSLNAFRLAQDGISTIKQFIGDKRKICIKKQDLIVLMENMDPTEPAPLNLFTKTTLDQMNKLDVGSCVINYKDEKLNITIVGWRGKCSLRAYTDINGTIHILRMLGADISKYDKNKFKKADENKIKDDVKPELVDSEVTEDKSINELQQE